MNYQKFVDDDQIQMSNGFNNISNNDIDLNLSQHERRNAIKKKNQKKQENYSQNQDIQLPSKVIFRTKQKDEDLLIIEMLDSNNYKPTEDKYEIEKIPPNWQFATKHAKALKVGRNFDLKPGVQTNICLCCGKQIQKQKVEYSDKIQKFSFLGIGYPLYLQFFTFAMFCLMVIFLTQGLYNIYSFIISQFRNYVSTNCIDSGALSLQIDKLKKNVQDQNSLDQMIAALIIDTCIDGWITRFSLINKRKDIELLKFQDMLNFSCLISLIIMINMCNKMQLDMIILCDDSETTPQDYSIVVQNLPKNSDKTYMQFKFELIQYFQKTHEVKVEQINFVYNLKYLKQQEKNLNDLINQKKMLMIERDKAFQLDSKDKKIQQSSKKDPQAVLNTIDKQIQLQKQLIFNIRDEYKNKRFKEEFTGVCFISFSNEKQKSEVIQAHELTLIEEINIIIDIEKFNQGKNLFLGNKLRVHCAPEPSNVNWYNMNKNPNRLVSQLKLTSLYYLIIAIICGFVFFFVYLQQNSVVNGLVIFGVESEQQQTKSQKQQLDDYHLFLQLESMGISFFLVIFNSILLRLITDTYVDLLQPFTISSQMKVCVQNLGLILFINQSLMVFLAVRFGQRNFWGPGGLVYSQFYVFIFDALQPFTNIILDPTIQVQKLKKYWYWKKSHDQYLTQQEANDIVRLPFHDIEIQYAMLLKTIFNAVFYASFLPLGVIMTIVSLNLFYFQEKYLIVYKRSIIFEIDEKISQKILKLLEFVIILNAAGTYFFENLFNKKSYLSEAALFISKNLKFKGLCFYIIPQQAIIESFLFDVENNPEEIDFQKAKKERFQDNYSLQNPVTRRYQINKKHRKAIYYSRLQNKEDQK